MNLAFSSVLILIVSVRVGVVSLLRVLSLPTSFKLPITLCKLFLKYILAGAVIPLKPQKNPLPGGVPNGRGGWISATYQSFLMAFSIDLPIEILEL